MAGEVEATASAALAAASGVQEDKNFLDRELGQV
jgi:hypothetical protein